MNKEKNKLIIIKVLLIGIIVVGLFFVCREVDFTKLLGSIYNIGDINSNIDSIQIGDKINYSANGVDDWEVLSINKGNNTIEVVSVDSVEMLTLTGYAGWSSAHAKMQDIANKYVTGPYAISARNLSSADLKSAVNMTKKGAFWVTDQTISKSSKNSDLIDNYIGCSYEQDYGIRNVSLVNGITDYGIRVIVTLNDANASNYSIGDTYSYSSNGINDWKVLYINSDNSISIVTTDKQLLDFATDDNIANGTNFFNKVLLDYYDNDSVSSVRLANYNDCYSLGNAGIRVDGMLTGIVAGSDSGLYTSNIGGIDYHTVYKYYNYQYVSYSDYYGSYQTYTTRASTYSIERGVRPVITLKYSDELIIDGSSLNTSIKLGDKVSYEANAYTDWKVLSIDEDNGTAEIVSSNIVKVLTLKGIEDYNDVESIFQKEVDEYLNGDNVISARMLNGSDIEKLTLIKDKITREYWLNNKKKYDYQDEYGNVYNDTIYAVAVASYNNSSLNIARQWSTLECRYNGNETTLTRYGTKGSYTYTAGIRPVIKVKLATLSKSDSDDNSTSNDEIEAPKNDHKAVADSSTNVNSSENSTETQTDDVTNNDNVQEENQCIVYDKGDNNNDDDVSDKGENLSNTSYIIVIVISVLCGGAISGLVVYYIVKRKYNVLNN